MALGQSNKNLSSNTEILCGGFWDTAGPPAAPRSKTAHLAQKRPLAFPVLSGPKDAPLSRRKGRRLSPAEACSIPHNSARPFHPRGASQPASGTSHQSTSRFHNFSASCYCFPSHFSLKYLIITQQLFSNMFVIFPQAEYIFVKWRL